MIVDTSVLLALFDGGDRAHAAVEPVFEPSDEPRVVSPYVVAEVDYLVSTRLGVPNELSVLRELASDNWDLATFDARDLEQATAVVEKYADQNIGFADASIVVLADKIGTRTIASLDHRHFDVMRPLRGGRFRLVP